MKKIGRLGIIVLIFGVINFLLGVLLFPRTVSLLNIFCGIICIGVVGLVWCTAGRSRHIPKFNAQSVRTPHSMLGIINEQISRSLAVGDVDKANTWHDIWVIVRKHMEQATKNDLA